MSRRLIWHDKEVMEVMELLVSCQKVDEVRNIFDHVLTTREINDIARRYKVFTMIGNGSSYTDIKLATGMSSTAISRISSKCGFGFRKSLGIEKKPIKKSPARKIHLNYKGVRVR